MSITITSKQGCSYCDKAKELLRGLNIPYEVNDITFDEEAKAAFSAKHHTYPQIWDGSHHIGGYVELCDYIIEEGLVA